jgi:hypothetical protein
MVRLRIFTVNTHAFTCTHSLARELLRRHGYPSRDAAVLEPHKAILPAPNKIVPLTRSSPHRPQHWCAR